MLAFSATTLWGRKRNKQALAVRGMVSALREATLYYGITEVGQLILPKRSKGGFLEEMMLD